MKMPLLLAGACLLAGALYATVDRDANGLSDVHEFIYFHGPADPFADPDGDGLSNAEEMIWGSSPTNALSRVTGPTAVVDGDSLLLGWPIAEGKYYRLQLCEDLQTWQTVAEGHISTHREALVESGVRFWRVQVFGVTPDADGNGLDDWEEAIWRQSYGAAPSRTDLDGDGLPDTEEFMCAHDPLKQDHPAVGLVVFTPLEK